MRFQQPLGHETEQVRVDRPLMDLGEMKVEREGGNDGGEGNRRKKWTCAELFVLTSNKSAATPVQSATYPRLKDNGSLRSH